MPGYPQDKTTLDGRAGFIVVTLREVLDDARQMDVTLAGFTDAELEAFGYSTADVALLRASFIDLAKVYRIAHGQDVQAEPSDFFYNAQHLAGFV